MEQFLTIFQSIGAVVGVILTLITFWGVISKKPKEFFRTAIREEATAANREMKNEVDGLKKKMESKDKTDLAILRNTLTHIYFKYKDAKKIPHYEKENVMYLFEQYSSLGGNSYVKQIVDEIKDWEEIIGN